MAERASVSSLATVPTKDVLRDLPQSTERSFFSKIAGIIPRMLFRLISFATISVPLFFYRVLTWSFTVHLNFSSLVVLVVIIATGVYLVVRYRFLTKYSRLKPIAPPKVVSSFDLHPDTGEDSEFSETGYKNYPDEFLSAFLSSIKIFGYLEQPVFHELARHLQTKKLLAGDTLFRNPEQERSFYIVVDGHVQMFVKPENAHEDSESSDEDELWGYDANRKDRFRDYSVINEVGPGGTLSSLFTILSIFKESFNKAEAKEKQRQKSIKSQLSRMAPMSNDLSFDMSREGSVDEWREVFPNLEKMDQHPGYYARPNSDNLRYRNRSTTVHPTVPSNMSEMDDPVTSESSELRDGGDLPSSKFTASLSPSSSYSRLRPELRASRSYRSVHPNIIARATVDTTLAVIPEEAFHKLTLKFPKAAAHIVQVIVTRFQRVTLSTSHKYLGLTKELLRLQKLVHESANLQQLPPEFYETGGMDRLRSKFKNEQASEEEENTTGPSEINRSESSGIIRAIGIIDLPGTPGLHMNPDAQGPMLSSSPNGTKQNRPLRRIGRREEYSVEDDENLRMAVRRCIADSLGVKLKPTINESDAKPFESSPRTTRRFPPDASDLSRSRYHYPMDLFSHTGTVDSNTSPSIDAFDSPYEDDADVRSTTSSVQSGSDIFGNTKYDPISVDDIQILYFPKDAVLVKEGAHSNGLFFVIDGLLEVSMTPTETADNIGNTDTPPLSRKSSHRDRRKSRVTHAGFTLSPSVSTSSSSANLVKLGDSAPANNSKTTSSKQDKVVASEAPAGRSNEKKSEKDDPERAKKPIFVIKPGGLAGYLDALTGYPSFVEIRAKTDTYVGYVSKKRLDHIIDKNPAVMFKLANQLVKHVSPLSKFSCISLSCHR
jgi:lysophospholipid hydrolase